jgi:hypothetical protein
MFRAWWWTFLVALVATGAFAQEISRPGIDPSRLLFGPRPKLPELPALSVGEVTERVAEHLATLPAEYRHQAVYFDLSATPTRYLEPLQHQLSFVLNHLSRAPTISRPQPVPNCDQRIYWAYQDWYHWTPKAWEQVSQLDPYFREPVVPSGPAVNYVRATAGNAIVRADWFAYWTMDVSLFAEPGQFVAKGVVPYYTLLYAKTKIKRKDPKTGKVVEVVGKAPENIDEFYQVWEADLEVLKRYNNLDKGAVVDEGDSLVSYHNRFIWDIPSRLGTRFFQTFDMIDSVKERDLLETLVPKKWDASEAIAQYPDGRQYYLLLDGAGKRVDWADPRLVRDTGDPHFIVKTPGSCVSCHVQGKHGPSNAVKDLIDSGADLKIKGYEKTERIRSLLLSNMDKNIKRSQEDYADAIKDCNGLSPAENVKEFNIVRGWYDSPLAISQAARECGVTVADMEAAIALGIKGRYIKMLTENKAIPRRNWEQGGFQELSLLLIEARRQRIIK